jgi:hypothetical protein
MTAGFRAAVTDAEQRPGKQTQRRGEDESGDLDIDWTSRGRAFGLDIEMARR